MPSPLAATVWHYWISWFLIIPSVLMVIGVLVGYLLKVVGPKHTRR